MHRLGPAQLLEPGKGTGPRHPACVQRRSVRSAAGFSGAAAAGSGAQSNLKPALR